MEIVEETNNRKKHMGRKVAKIREFLGVKQESLAITIGVTQQTISKMEREEDIADEKLKEVANALGVTPEAIKSFDEDRVFYYINNVQEVHTNSVGIVNGDYKSINPIDKLVEVYERLLASEREKIELLKNLKKDR